MPTTRRIADRLPGRFPELVRLMPPRAIVDAIHYEETLEIIDRLMSAGKLTSGQESYLETLVQLVEAYETAHLHIETRDLSGTDALRHLLTENGLSASDLARLLGLHPSMGSKILNGERSLTVTHLKLLSERFGVRPDLFLS